MRHTGLFVRPLPVPPNAGAVTGGLGRAELDRYDGVWSSMQTIP
jgi:hypothetical protein